MTEATSSAHSHRSYAEKNAQEQWETLYHDKGAASCYFTILAAYIDRFVAPSGNVFPSNEYEWHARNLFIQDQPELAKIPLKEWGMFPFQPARTATLESMKWHQLAEEPQIYRQMVHYMGAERADCFMQAIGNIPNVRPDPEMGRRDWAVSEEFYARQREHFSIDKYKSALLGARTSAENANHTDEENQAHWKSVTAKARPTGTWKNWINEPPRIPYQDETRGR